MNHIPENLQSPLIVAILLIFVVRPVTKLFRRWTGHSDRGAAIAITLLVIAAENIVETAPHHPESWIYAVGMLGAMLLLIHRTTRATNDTQPSATADGAAEHFVDPV